MEWVPSLGSKIPGRCPWWRIQARGTFCSSLSLVKNDTNGHVKVQVAWWASQCPFHDFHACVFSKAPSNSPRDNGSDRGRVIDPEDRKGWGNGSWYIVSTGPCKAPLSILLIPHSHSSLPIEFMTFNMYVLVCMCSWKMNIFGLCVSTFWFINHVGLYFSLGHSLPPSNHNILKISLCCYV